MDARARFRRHRLGPGRQSRKPAEVPVDWRERMETHENAGSLVDTSEGEAFVTMLPFRMPRPSRPPEAERPAGAPGNLRVYLIELAIPIKAVTGAFDGLRRNLIVGLIAAIALLISVAVIGLRTPQYLRGKYLESELLLAKRVQRDLQPQATFPVRGRGIRRVSG